MVGVSGPQREHTIDRGTIKVPLNYMVKLLLWGKKFKGHFELFVPRDQQAREELLWQQG